MKKTPAYCLAILLPFVMYPKGVPFPEPGHEGLNVKKLGTFGGFDHGLWLQYRVMYNNSNIPGPGGTTFLNSTNYDFFRQRFRIGFDIRSSEKIGAYTQFEYRGSWGGSSPATSDARGLPPSNNPYNRLQSRGIRYGFIYYSPNEQFNLSAGIIPLTDRVGRLLFDADWDFSVGGVTIGGTIARGDYRICYVRLVEGVGGTKDQFDKNGDLFIADYNISQIGSLEIGAHFYSLSVPEALGTLTSKSERWYGLTAKRKMSLIDFNGMVLLNSGKIGTKSHDGTAVKLEGTASFSKSEVGVLLITTTGDDEEKIDKRFVTLHQLVDTEGFWGYTHIFTANGPSDVNDFALEIGNGSAGLTTVQGRVDYPINDRIDVHLFAGWFRSDKERNNSKDLGVEFGGMFKIKVAKYLNWELGGAFASIGDFYIKDAKNLNEIFSRFQYTW